MTRPEIYLDVRTVTVDDLTLIMAENRLAELDKRISPFELKFDNLGKPIGMEFDSATELGRMEMKGTLGIRQLALAGNRVIAWFSPAGGNSPYKENRMVVAVVKEIRQDKSVVFDCRGICSQHNREEFIDRVELITGKIENGDELRSQPVALKTDEKWFEYLGEIFDDIPEVWLAIAEGEDLRNKIDLNKIALEIQRNFGVRMAGAKTYDEAVIVGAQVESFISKYGINLMAGGGHGMSNTAVLAMRPSFGMTQPFNYIFEQSRIVTRETEGARRCEKCGVYYLGEECPFCGV